MKFQYITIAALASMTMATPVPNAAIVEASRLELEARQSGDTSDDLVNGICRQVTFIFARGSTESGNMGTVVGPQTCASLQDILGASNVACQGVGAPYAATLVDNLLPQNTSPTAIGAATAMFNLANTHQGTAVMDGSIQALPAALQAKVKGVVLFGFTRNAQDGGRIPNYPTSQTKVYCADGDLVCNNTLIITSAHFTYGADAPAAAAFLAQEVAL
ncbi:cutinase-4 [Coleophoma crateriformis]|uniref:cutinase n=1 Tax=Coleophoma crateriformis TaxID=565419 RepID=A0A3D8Q6F7_9HELO|nr:cutinase-4 [Coleophoma crateriformis]